MTTDLAVRQPIDYQAVLRTLRLDPARPETQALLLVCQRYGLDPVMRHIVLIDGRPYVTRDGLLHVAHMSGQLGGMEVIEETETDTEWTARVAIHRTDMPRPFVYRGRYPKSGGNKRYGPEMAVKCFDPETEVLTDQGFQRFDTVTGLVLQVTDSGLERTHAEPWSDTHRGPLVVNENQYLNFAVTPNHDMITTAGRVEAAAMYETSRRRPQWYVPHVVETSQPGLDVSNTALMLAAAYVCDGNSGRIKVGRPRKIEMLRTALGDPRWRVPGGAVATTRAGRQIVSRLDQYGWQVDGDLTGGLVDMASKCWRTDLLMQLSLKQAEVVIESLVDFDGSRSANGKRTYFSSREDHIGAAELIALIAGMTVSKRRARQADIGGVNWNITISPRSRSPVTRTGRAYHETVASRPDGGLRLVDYDGPVWCVTVPSGAVVVRRHGYAMLAGNCSEVMGLRRAFDVALATVEEQWDATAPQPIDAAPAPPAETPHAVEMDAVEAAIAEAEQAGVPVDVGKARGYAQQSAANAMRTVETLRQRIRDHTAGDGPGLPSDPATDEQMDRVVALHAALVTAGADRADLPRTTARRATGGSTDLDDLTCVQADQLTADLTEWLARLTGEGAS